jgi:hypothetical protein
MKMLFYSVMTTVIAAMSLIAADTVSGTWQIHQNISGNESDLTCTFTPTGNDLAGTCVAADRTMKFTGNVSEKKVTFTVQTEYNGAPLTMKYSGTLTEATKMTGTVIVEPYNAQGEFTATPTK